MFFIVFFVMLQPAMAWAWSSTDFLYTPFQTHEYFNQIAYEELEKHPAFMKSNFPSLPDIQNHSMVTKSRTGLGPDGAVNSYYSFHWYNPRANLGNAPAAAQAYYDRLLTSFEGKTPGNQINVNGIRFNDPHVEPAHSAAYAAHYVQDMTCAFHVIGMPASDVNPDRVASNTVNGPFRTYSLDDWRNFTYRYVLAKANDPLMDWFDVTYWDGNRLYSDMRGSHFLYEGLVEMAYKNAKSAAWMIEFQHQGFQAPYWLNSESPRDRIAGIAERLASATRNALDSNANGARIDTVQFQKDLEIGLGTMSGGVAAQVYQAVGNYIKVPYADWWAAIQATYCVWRSALCALWMEETDIEMLRLPGQKDQYKLRVVIQNLEKEAAVKDVKVEFSFKNGPSAKGEIDVGMVESDDGSLFKDSEESFLLTPESRSKGILCLRVTGRYDKIPDLGVFTKEFELKRIRLREFTMPKLNLLTREDALKIAKGDPYHFKVDVDSSKEPEKGNLVGIVYSQEPVPGVIVAEHEPVILRAYADYYVTVPGVIGMTEKQAMSLIEAVDLKPKPARIDVPYDQPDGIVLEQKPGKDAKVRPRTDVVISVSKCLPPPPKKPDVPVVQTPQPQPVTPQQPQTQPEPPLRELQVSPSGATIEVGQSVGLTAIPIALFPERPVTNQVVAGMSFQWFANLPGFASVGGGGRTASVTGLKPGTVSIYCVTEQAMGLATIIIVEPKNKTGNSVSSAGGFKDSSDEWKTETKDSGSNVIPDVPPPPSRQGFSNDPFANQFPDVPKPPSTTTGPAPGVDPAYEQQLLYEEQLRQQQAYYDELQRQQQMMNAMGNMLNMMNNQLQQPQNPNNRNIQPPPGLNIPPMNPPAVPPKTGIKPNPPSPPTVSTPVEGGGGTWRGQTGPRNSATGQPVQNNELNLLNQKVDKPIHTGSFGNCPKCGKTLIGGPACICGWKK